jgi:hypothetical protein
MAENKNKIIVYRDWLSTFDSLTDEEAGKLIKHFFKYINDLNPVAPDRLTQLLFEPIKQTLKRDLKAYEAKCDTNRDNIESRWGKKGFREVLSPDIEQVYILRLYCGNENFIKIGQTFTSISRRFSGKLPYQYEILAQLFTDESTELERYFTNLLREFNYTPKLDFRGKLECYNIDCLSILQGIQFGNLNIHHNTSHYVALQRYTKHTDSDNDNDSDKDNDIDIDIDSEKKEKKIKYSAFISLLPSEYEKLISEHGEKNTKTFIEILNNYKGATGKKYKSDYLAILNWVVDKAKKEGKYESQHIKLAI